MFWHLSLRCRTVQYFDWDNIQHLNVLPQDVLRLMDKYWLGHWRCLIHGTVPTADGGISLSDVTQRVCHDVYKETKIRLPPHIVQVCVHMASWMILNKDLIKQSRYFPAECLCKNIYWGLLSYFKTNVIFQLTFARGSTEFFDWNLSLSVVVINF